MAESSVAVTEGSGKNLHTWSRTVSATTVQNQVVLVGEYPYPAYVVGGSAVAVSSAGAHLLQIMAGASDHVYLRRIWIQQGAAATSAATLLIGLFRLTSAGSGGTSVTPLALSSADSASGCTAMTLPSSKGTEAANAMYRFYHGIRVTEPVSLASENMPVWQALPNMKGIRISAGTSNGIAFKLSSGTDATATIQITVEVVEMSYS